MFFSDGLTVPPLIGPIQITDDGAGIYACAKPTTDVTFPGSALFKSPDDVTFSNVGTTTTAAVFGTASTTLGSGAVGVFDEVNALNYPRRRCHPTPVDGFRVYIPDETRSQFVPHVTTGCAKVGVHLISHRPYR